MECTKTAENEKIILAAKKKPQKSDIFQLRDFASKNSVSKIYVYVEEPSTAFKKAMDELKNRVSFWNAETLTHELFSTSLRFYLFMVLENSFEPPIFEMVYSFFKVFFRVEKKEVKQPSKATPEMLNLLWAAKDRSASLNKSLRNLQYLFERMNLSEINEEITEKMTLSFLSSIENLKYENLDQLQSLFSEFLEKYPENFEQFCKQTKGRSNWTYWASSTPTLSPGYIIKSIENEKESAQKVKDFLDKQAVPESKPASLSEIFGDVARILANEIFMFEEAVDDLFSIGLFGKWEDMREEFARMGEKRSDELKKGVKNELCSILDEINQNLKEENYQARAISTEVFSNYKQELKQYLCLNDFMLLQQTYSKVLSLEIQSNLPDVNKRKYEDTKKAIEKTIIVIEKKDIWEDFEATCDSTTTTGSPINTTEQAFPESFFAERIAELKKLIEEKAEEPLFQSFFEKNPTLLDSHVVKMFSKKSFGGEQFPDLILVLGNGNNIIVELEKPSFRLYTKDGNPTQELSHAEEQTREYLSWAIEEKEFLRKRGLENLSADNTTGLLVIGSDLTIAERKRLTALNNSVRGSFVIKTFCDILSEYETFLKNLMQNSRFHETI